MSRLSKIFTFIAVVLAPAAALAGAVGAFEEALTGVVTIVAADGHKSAAGQFVRQGAAEGRVLGSGIVISENGLILTANHTVAGSDGFTVVFCDLTELYAKLVASEPLLDIAILKVGRSGLRPLPWRVDEPPLAGETVFTIGTPSAFSADLVPSISGGIVSAHHRTIETRSQTGQRIFLTDLIETDAQVSPGESGGALVDGKGRLLGMCLARYNTANTGRGRAYAIPADAWLRRAIDALAAGGVVPIGELGAQVSPLGIERAEGVGVRARSGVEVTWLDDGGPFEKAGILVGDIVTKINGEAVRRTTRFRQIEMRLDPGSTAEVNVVRSSQSKPLGLEVTVAGHERAEFRADNPFAWRGMRLVALSDGVRRKYGTHYRDGVVVVGIDRGSNAYQAGVRTGEVIFEVNNIIVKTLADFRSVVMEIPRTNVVKVRTSIGIGHIHGESLPE